MHSVILVIHMILAVAIIGVVLLQRSEGGGLGMGSSGGMGALATPRSTANFLTRLTGILAAGFMLTSLTLAIMAESNAPEGSILDAATPVSAPAPGAEVSGADAGGGSAGAVGGNDAIPAPPSADTLPEPPVSQ